MADKPAQDDAPEGSGAGAPRSSAAARLAAKRAAKAAAKASKKGTAPIVPEGVASSVTAAGSLYSEHTRLFWGAFAVLALGGVAWIAVTTHMNKSASEAAELLGAGVKTSQALVLEEGETPPDDDAAETYPSESERAQKALDEYRSVLGKYPGSRAATWAKLGEATSLYDLGKNAEAQKAFEAALAAGRKDGDGFVTWRALQGAAFALEAQGKRDEALKRLDELVTLDNGAYKPVAEFHRGRLLAAGGDKAKAIDVLEAMVKGERERSATEGERFESTLTDAETLLSALAVELGKPKLEPRIPSSASGGSALGGGQQGLSPELMEALRKQLEQQGVNVNTSEGEGGE